MSEWIRTLAYLVLAVTFLELLAPQNQMKGLVKIVIGFFITAAVVMPAINWMRSQRDLEVFPFYQEFQEAAPSFGRWEVSEPGQRQAEALYRAAIGLEATRRLQAEGIPAQVRVEWSSEEGISAVYAELTGKADPEKVRSVLAEFLGVSPQRIRVKY
ncbi:MAG: stage III sporulation protein AF [Firmicutes bacterium]|nr:stage III sporulation protein AF [Bacillota bacterium]